jgi:hypothetical protein
MFAKTSFCCLDNDTKFSLGCLSSPSNHFDGKRILEDTMKKLVLAAALTAAASTAFAGTMEDPIVEAPIIEEAASSSNAAIWVPLILLAVIVAAAAS